ncbi:MAG: hypothetical protein WDN04_16620 [Rhodospirillales bacterium]
MRQVLAARLMANSWFARNVVIDRWFLHSQQSAMRPQAGRCLKSAAPATATRVWPW